MMVTAFEEQTGEVFKLLEKQAPSLSPQRVDALTSLEDAAKVLDAGSAAEVWRFVSKGPNCEVARRLHAGSFRYLVNASKLARFH